MTDDQQKAELATAQRVLLEEAGPLTRSAVEHQAHGVLHVSLHYQKGKLTHMKSSFEKTRQMGKS